MGNKRFREGKMTTKQINTKEGLSKEFKYLLAGTPVNIDIVTPAGKKGRFRTIFIGYLPEQFILIQFPDANKLGSYSQYITQGSQVTVRGLVEGHEASVIAFISTIKQTLSQPSRIMVLNFPDNMVIHNLRSTKRVLTDLTANIALGDNQWQVKITDVSLSGCHIEVSEGGKDELTEGEQIEIVIEATEQENLTIKARVCNVKLFENGVEFGCQFLGEQDNTIEKIVHTALLSEK